MNKKHAQAMGKLAGRIADLIEDHHGEPLPASDRRSQRDRDHQRALKIKLEAFDRHIVTYHDFLADGLDDSEATGKLINHLYRVHRVVFDLRNDLE